MTIFRTSVATGWLTASVGADGTEVSYSRRNGGGISVAASVGGTTSYAFDVAGRKTHISSPAGSFALGYCEWNGKLAAVTNASGFVVQYAYDIMDRVANIAWRTTSGATLGGFEYEYDAVGRIVSRSHMLGDSSQPSQMSQSSQKNYAYDDLDRLASDDGVTYAYDAAGNRMTRTENGATATYTLGVGDQLASWTGGAYTHDVAGNVTRIERDGRPTLDLTWNSQYQLVSVATNGVFAESYEYDALGRRVATANMEGSTRHVYDDNWQVVADLDEQENVIASYTWGEGIDNLLAVKVGGASYYPLRDIQGTVWGYVDSQNNVVARWRYDAWGNVVDESVSVPELASLRYRFQGREWSAATGLIHFRMRWYDAETSRWLSKDPIGLSGGLNLYVFCGDSPIKYLDPFGKNFLKDWWDDNIVHPIAEGILNHWNRNNGLNDPSNLPQSPSDAEKEYWKKLPLSKSVYHNRNGAANSKYVSPDGHREAVFDHNGRLVTDSYNMGTYNFYGPDNNIGHIIYDVIPYLLLGNTPDDAFDYWDRLQATLEAVILYSIQ